MLAFVPIWRAICKWLKVDCKPVVMGAFERARFRPAPLLEPRLPRGVAERLKRHPQRRRLAQYKRAAEARSQLLRSAPHDRMQQVHIVHSGPTKVHGLDSPDITGSVPRMPSEGRPCGEHAKPTPNHPSTLWMTPRETVPGLAIVADNDNDPGCAPLGRRPARSNYAQLTTLKLRRCEKLPLLCSHVGPCPIMDPLA